MSRTIEDVIDTLKNAKLHNRKCTLLIGSGCSVSANIPTASGFVEIIKKRWRSAYDRADEKTYPKCMALLAEGERRDLIASYVDNAVINWAHIGIAQLMKNGYVDRVLTTNFDPLVVRACALAGEFPAVYDFAASQHFKPEDIPDKAIFYLHGQRTGFKLMNTDDECKEHSERLAPVFNDVGQGRVWLVVGYSGDCDPVFDHLANISRFDHNLYWIGHKDSEPAEHVRTKLLIAGKYAFHVSGFDADSFFVTLAQKLDCFPPDFIAKPFTHLDACLNLIADFPIPGKDTTLNIMKKTRQNIQAAIKEYEADPGNAEVASISELESLMVAGNYDEVIRRGKAFNETYILEEVVETISWAHIMKGIVLSNQAETKSGEEADKLFADAYQEYEAALKIKPDKHEALYNWGYALLSQAKTKFGEEADKLFNLAVEKYLEAESILPGEGSYDLACLSALRGDYVGCRKWLEKSRELGSLPDRNHIKADTDLDAVRNKKWFKEFLATL